MSEATFMLNDTDKTKCGLGRPGHSNGNKSNANNNDRNHKYDVSFVHDSRKCEHREHTNLHDCFYGVIQADLCLFILSPGEKYREKRFLSRNYELRRRLQETFLVQALVRSLTRTVAVDILQLTFGRLDALLSSHKPPEKAFTVDKLLAFCSSAPIPSQEYKLFR